MEEVLKYQEELSNMDTGKILDRMLCFQSEISPGMNTKTKETKEMKILLSKLEVIRRTTSK